MEVNYLPEPRPQPPTAYPSRQFGPVTGDGGNFVGAVRVTSAQSPRFTVDDGTNEAFSIFTAGGQIIRTTGFSWLTFIDALNTSQPVGTELYHVVSGATPGANVGVSMDFRADTTGAARTLGMRLTVLFPTATTPVTAEARFTLPVAGVNTEILRIQQNGLSLFQTQVLGSRKTGWTAATGTPTRTTFDTATVTTAQLAERVKALLDDLTSHGLIGA